MDDKIPGQYWRAFFEFAASAGASDSVNAEQRPVLREMEEEDRAFLRAALAKYAKDTDPIVRMKALLDQLVDLSSRDLTEEQTERAAESLFQLTELCGFGDLAVDFCRIGGVRLLTHFVLHDNEQLKAQALELAGELCQNNPDCQNTLTSVHFLPLLMRLLNEESSELVRQKTLYALSSLTRGNRPVERLFCESDGITKLIYQMSFPRLAAKACFMLANIVDSMPEYKGVACEQQAMETLVELCKESNDTTLQEQALNALLSVVKCCPQAIKVAQQKKNIIRSTLDTVLARLEEDTDSADLVELCTKIIRCCYPEERQLNRGDLKKPMHAKGETN